MKVPRKPTNDGQEGRLALAKRRYLLVSSTMLIISLLALVYSYFIEPQRLIINAQELHIPKLNPALDGLKIVAISDIHGGSNGVDEAKLRHVVDTANAQHPDLIVLLGDYVSQTGPRGPDGRRALRMPLETIAANLAGFRARIGVYAVLGNHDGWHDNASVAAALESVGYEVLDGEVAVVQRGGTSLRILGLKDHMQITSWARFSADAQKLLAATDPQGDVIVLEHSPDVAPIIARDHPLSDQLRLLLAGHTHGGQIWLPVLGRPVVPSSYGQRFAAGHAVENGVDVFVTTGVGTSILPFRFGVPPEIAVITLRSK